MQLLGLLQQQLDARPLKQPCCRNGFDQQIQITASARVVQAGAKEPNFDVGPCNAAADGFDDGFSLLWSDAQLI